MIINFKSRWIFIFPPKTASTSLSRVLQTPAFRGVSHQTGNPRVIDQHWPWPPKYTEDFAIFLSVRHPLTRVVSQYRHYVKLYGVDHPAARSFDAWVDRLMEPDLMPHPTWALTCSGWLPEGLRPRLRGVVHAERMSEDLEALGLARGPFRVPTLNVGLGPTPILEAAHIERILAWGREDLERFYTSDGGADVPWAVA